MDNEFNPEVESGEDLFEESERQEVADYEPSQEEDRSTDRTYEDYEGSSEANTGDSSHEKSEDDDLYGQGEEGSENEDSEGDGEYEYNDRVNTLEYLMNHGYLEKTDLDYSSYTEDDLDSIIESSMDNIIEDKIRQRVSQLPDIVRQLNDYAMNGGDVRAFFSQIAAQNAQGIQEGMDINDPQAQEIIVYNTLQSQGYPAEYINSQIEFLKGSNNLHHHANVYYNQFLERRRAELDNMAEQQRQAELNARRAIEMQRDTINRYVDSIDDVGGLALSVRDRKEIADYMTTPRYTLENGSTITELQKDLYYDLMQNQETVVQLALLLKNRNDDGTLNLSAIRRQAETQVTRKAKESLQRKGRSAPSSNSGKYPTYKQKSLDSYFE